MTADCSDTKYWRAVQRGDFLRQALALYSQAIPYVWGGKTPNPKVEARFKTGGLDCSGFITFILYNLSGGLTDIRPTHDAATLCNQLPEIPAPIAGDLVFYGDTQDHASHVMLALNDLLVVGQAYGGRSNTDPVQSRLKNFTTKVLPLDYRQDRVAVCRPPYDR